ncbi:MAG TPA: ArsC family reductase, partial [Thiolinea sp.]|nr:ArsC family reductase [Thiolinea sp.]
MIILYGISNCDTVRKARQWLDERAIAYEFHDWCKDGLNPVQLRAWADELGWENLVNRRGTTWRNLPEAARENMNETLALAVMEDQPSLIKRPLLELGSRRLLGFDAEQWKTLFQN